MGTTYAVYYKGIGVYNTNSTYAVLLYVLQIQIVLQDIARQTDAWRAKRWRRFIMTLQWQCWMAPTAHRQGHLGPISSACFRCHISAVAAWMVTVLPGLLKFFKSWLHRRRGAAKGIDGRVAEENAQTHQHAWLGDRRRCASPRQWDTKAGHVHQYTVPCMEAATAGRLNE